MIDSIAELVIVSLIIAWIFKSIHLPELVGMLFVGVLFGPYVLNRLSPELLDVSGQLRLVALIVILLRAGFELKRDTLNRIGRPAILLSMIPALFETVAICLLSPLLLGLSYMEGAILGTVIAAVSPAVVVPLMIRFIEEKKGTKKGIPTLILAASSIDDVFVIVIYSVLIGIYTGNEVNVAWQLAGIPISIVLGIAVGIACGLILLWFFKKFNPRATKRVLVIMAVSVLLLRIEQVLANIVPFAALLSVMSIGFIILEKQEKYAHEISNKLAKIWVVAEIALFTLVGSEVNIEVAWQSGLHGVILIILGLVARSMGTWISIIGTDLNFKEKLFVVISYWPKATVQAAIGAAPLMAMKLAGMDTAPGQTILAVAVLSIVLTAPTGAIAIVRYGNKWLEKE
ncbi:MAG: sodium:proton antiporter [Calditrichaeota bacterium]|nr:MAG: sodium:proton antiporter [Calditrichota bacterium]